MIYSRLRRLGFSCKCVPVSDRSAVSFVGVGKAPAVASFADVLRAPNGVPFFVPDVVGDVLVGGVAVSALVSAVLRVCNPPEIFNAIVAGVPVDVVNLLVAPWQGPLIVHQEHNVMAGDTLPSELDPPVAVRFLAPSHCADNCCPGRSLDPHDATRKIRRVLQMLAHGIYVQLLEPLQYTLGHQPVSSGWSRARVLAHRWPPHYKASAADYDWRRLP